jgi:hypothetical protein
VRKRREGFCGEEDFDTASTQSTNMYQTPSNVVGEGHPIWGYKAWVLGLDKRLPSLTILGELFKPFEFLLLELENKYKRDNLFEKLLLML